jgi:outer membrane protein OmpA-like peptidoglycan-associated protein
MKTRIATIAIALLCVAGTVQLSAQSAICTVITLTGQMLNANTLTAVECSYGLYDATGKKVGQTNRSSASDGYLVTGLRPGESYTIRIEDPRYFKQEYKIDLPKTSKYAEISKDFTVKPMEAGRSLTLAPNPFDVKKSTLKVGAEEVLDDIAKLLIMNPSVSVDIVCYPDADGSADQIQKVSTDRGGAIKAYFMKIGIGAQRVTVRPVSSTDPINPPPIKKGAKGKRYVGAVYVVVTKV